MRVNKSSALMGRSNGGFLRGQHQLIQLALSGTELAICREGARDVAGVTVQLATSVDQHQVATQNGRSICTVVQNASVGATGHDGTIGWVLRAMLSEFMQQLCVQVILAHILARPQHGGRSLHGANVRTRTDLGSTAHDVQLVRIFDQTHFIQNAAHIALLLRAQSAIANPCAHSIQASFNARRQIFVRGKGVPNHRFVFQQGWQFGVQRGNRPCGIDTQMCRRSFWAQTYTIPNFTFQIFGLAEQT